MVLVASSKWWPLKIVTKLTRLCNTLVEFCAFRNKTTIPCNIIFSTQILRKTWFFTHEQCRSTRLCRLETNSENKSGASTWVTGHVASCYETVGSSSSTIMDSLHCKYYVLYKDTQQRMGNSLYKKRDSMRNSEKGGREQNKVHKDIYTSTRKALRTVVLYKIWYDHFLGVMQSL